MAMEALTISISWAIAQYRQVIGIAGRLGGPRPPRLPSDPPEVARYFHSIGLGRNIDAYA